MNAGHFCEHQTKVMSGTMPLTRQSTRKQQKRERGQRTPRSASTATDQHRQTERNQRHRKIRISPLRAGSAAEVDAETASAKRRRQSDVNHPKGAYTFIRASGAIADWDDYLRDLTAISWICPVDYFPNAPLAKQWQNFAIDKIGAKIELPHPRSVGLFPVYSVATIVTFAGYKALVKFENTENTNNHYAWISYCGDQPKPLGYSIANNLLVLPVENIINNNEPNHAPGILQFVERIYGTEASSNSICAEYGTLNQFFVEWQKGNKFKLNDYVEAMDKEDPVRNRLAVITAIVGDRVQVLYHDGMKNDHGFCFNVHSDLIHPCGWSKTVGVGLVGTTKPAHQFPVLPTNTFPVIPENISLQTGMIFEVRHPYFPYKLATGVVQKKLKFGYFIASIKTNNKNEFAEFVFHVTSDYILPCGFSNSHNIALEQPLGEDESFSWTLYLETNQLKPLLPKGFNRKRSHRFVKGCKLEAVDVFEPMYFGPATILNVAEHLIYIHFDGWPRDEVRSYQWISAFSHDLYPAGWAEMVGHRLQGHAERPQSCDSFYIPNRNKSIADSMPEVELVEV